MAPVRTVLIVRAKQYDNHTYIRADIDASSPPTCQEGTPDGNSTTTTAAKTYGRQVIGNSKEAWAESNPNGEAPSIKESLHRHIKL